MSDNDLVESSSELTNKIQLFYLIFYNNELVALYIYIIFIS